jgi:hypothetical protein
MVERLSVLQYQVGAFASMFVTAVRFENKNRNSASFGDVFLIHVQEDKMLTNKRLSFFVLIALLFAFAVSPATAATVYDWNVTSATINGSGTLTLGDEVATGVFKINDVTGTFSDTANDINGVVTDPFLSNGGTQTSPDGLYFFDNIAYTTPGLTFSNSGGLLFLVNGGASFANGAEVNIAGNGVGGYQLWESMIASPYLPGSGSGYAVEFSASAPEPGTLLMFGGGIALVGLSKCRRNARKQ